MTNEELKRLFETSSQRIDELAQKYYAGLGLSRQDCLEMRQCNKRLRAVAMELWIQQGKPEGEEFEILRNPPEWQPFPWAKPLDLTKQGERGGIN